MQKTKIPWADYTWNPIRGCSPVSEGCANCYAARMASRFSGPGQPYEGLAKAGKWTGQIKYVEKEYDAPNRARKAGRIFVCSMSDLFHEKVDQGQLFRLFTLMYYPECNRHQFYLLTKRPDSMAFFMERWLRHTLLKNNIWHGVTVENQPRADERIMALLLMQAANRFISVEPMLGPVSLKGPWLEIHKGRDRRRIDWVICGCESGPGRRPFNPDWARSLRDQCQEAGIPFFYKQGPDKNGRIVDMPELDGRVWDQVPE